jgi:hypothetical protein
VPGVHKRKEEPPIMPASPLANQRFITSEHLQQMARETMSAHFLRLRESGNTNAIGPEEFYGFRATDVAEMHSRKQGWGRGVWYRLKDGRVIDALGKPSHPERYWYVSNAH